jgi:8-oxo-dGTP diphosphatase
MVRAKTKTNLGRSVPCPYCGRYDNRPIGSAALIVRGNRILLARRGVAPSKGYWGLPGGHVEWDESPEDTAEREVKEETGLKVDKLRLFGVYGHPRNHPRQAISLVYLAIAHGKEQRGGDADQLQWFPLDSLPAKIAFDYRRIIHEYSRGQRNVARR